MKLKIVILGIILLTPLISSGYSNSTGIQDGDVVLLDYMLTVDDEEFERGDNVQMTVSEEDMIEGFYEGVLGMKIGEQKEIVVQSKDGYDSGELAGKTLYFDVIITELLYDVNDPDNPNNTNTDAVIRWIMIVVWGGIGITALFLLKNYVTRKIRIPPCVHCKTEGRDVMSEGSCKHCGQAFCRTSYKKGCPNCHGNTFVTHKK